MVPDIFSYAENLLCAGQLLPGDKGRKRHSANGIVQFITTIMGAQLSL